MRIQLQLLVLSMLLVACDKVPSAYIGNFSNDDAKLSLSGAAASFSQGDVKISSPIQDLTIAELKNGVAGSYAVADTADKSIVKIYFVRPNVDSKQEGGGILWYQSEVAIVALNTKAKAVSEVQVTHCDDGTVSVDTAENRWQIGCPSEAVELTLKRVP